MVKSTTKDAIDMLMQDHKDVKAMFKAYEGLSDRSRASKKKLAVALEECSYTQRVTV